RIEALAEEPVGRHGEIGLMHPLHDLAHRHHRQPDQETQHPGENDEGDFVVAELAPREGADQRADPDAHRMTRPIGWRGIPRAAPREGTRHPGGEARREGMMNRFRHDPTNRFYNGRERRENPAFAQGSSPKRRTGLFVAPPDRWQPFNSYFVPILD